MRIQDECGRALQHVELRGEVWSVGDVDLDVPDVVAARPLENATGGSAGCAQLRRELQQPGSTAEFDVVEVTGCRMNSALRGTPEQTECRRRDD